MDEHLSWLADLLSCVDAMKDAVDTSAEAAPAPAADRLDGLVYRHDDDLRTVVKIALATGRPLLLLGEPGAGKSSFAAYVARNLGWRYYEHVATRRTEATDLLWNFDAVRKLADAQQTRTSGRELRDDDYVEPGPLWWALDRSSASRRGLPVSSAPQVEPREPHADLNRGRGDGGAVVLIDEIGKASPEVLDALLVPLGSLTFRIGETGVEVGPPAAPYRLLIVLTSNDERDPSEAFVRRCIVHRLTAPREIEDYVAIATLHLAGDGGELNDADRELCGQIAAEVVNRRKIVADRGYGRGPSTAEFLDAVWACKRLGIAVGDARWTLLHEAVLDKSDPGGGALR